MSGDVERWPEGYARLVLDEVDSTMAEAARRAPDISGPTWIMARRQTRGRGRQGRSWQDPPGNLAATLIFRPGCTAGEAARRSFLAANALFETLAIHTDRSALSLKWPNDVLLDGGKVAGILLECRGSGPFVDWLSIGIGVNLAGVPAGLGAQEFPPVSLAAASGEPPVDAERFLTLLAGHYATEEDILATFGFGRIREAWLRHAARLGERITAKTGRETLEGRFETVDEDGNLVLETDAGRRVIAAAEVHF